ncbi:hypothetical protein ACQ4LE_002010 [Meloidogyne hapla]
MLFYQFILTNLLLFFIENLSQQFVEGMDYFHPGCHSYVQKLPNKKEFNIVDLSLLIHILNKIEDHEINNLTDLKIQDVLIFKRNVVLDNFYGNGNWHGDPEIKNFTLKVDAAIEYFENKILKPYLNAIDIHFKYATDEENENFIRARLAGQRNFMPKDHFDFFLYTYGFKSDEQGNISRIELNQEEDVYQSQLLQNPTQGEKNLFIFYQLFTLARTLIKLFVNHKNFNGVDDRSYAKFYLEDFGRPNINFQISLLGYIHQFDEFEVRANQLYKYLIKLHIFNAIQNYQVLDMHGNYVVRYSPLYELQRNELDFHQSYIPTFEVQLFSQELRMTLAEKQLLEDSIRGRYDLYHIYYSKQLVPHYLQTQLEQQVINPNFKQIFDSIGYNKNLTQMQKIGRIIIPPQRRRFGHLVRDYIEKYRTRT